MSNITIPKALLQQALEALVVAWQQNPHWQITEAMNALRAALEEPVPHGCHCDLEEHMSPDGCVLDENMPDNCIYARRLLREGKGKTDCEYWKPIEVKR